MSIMIGVDPHRATHTAVAVDHDENVIDKLRIRASKTQTRRLCEWAGQFDDKAWAVESARGLGYLLAQQQLVAAGETVFDVPPCSRRGCGCWGQDIHKRMTPTTLERSRSQRCGQTAWPGSVPMITPKCCACW